MPSYRIVVASNKYTEASLEVLRSVGEITQVPPDGEAFDVAMAEADALLIRTQTEVTEETIARAPKLRVIGRGGVGVDNIDLNACRARGIDVVYTPGAATDAVADLAVGLMLSTLRGLSNAAKLVQAGEFSTARRTLIGREIGSMTLGIVGLGRIGRAVGQRCADGFGMQVQYHDVLPVEAPSYQAQSASFDEVLKLSDIVSLHVPLTHLTKGMINSSTLAMMRPGSILINTSRGAVVDTSALVESLSSGRLAGAGLDVTYPEPLPADHPLLSMPSAHVTAHMGSNTRAAQDRMSDVVHDVVRVLCGEKPEFSVLQDRY
ncbi:MAG: hydroxyacid dehydrogenase [Phycisphaerae bacterium]